jgi:periplasmic divalent cation tolerance protein
MIRGSTETGGADMADHVQVHTTTETLEDAERIADALLEGRLAACVQILGPIRSRYRWRGSVKRAEEWLLLIKTAAARYDALERTVLDLHPYEVPELTATPVTAGSAAYLGWISTETGSL